MGFLGMKVYDDPIRQPTNAPFGTYMIVAPTAFFLGILFMMFPYDYPLLWSSTPPTEAFLIALEAHLAHLYNSPPIISRILHIAISIGFLGFFTKLFKPSESNLLFDGSSLVLYVVGVVVYLTNIVKGLKVVSEGDWEELARMANIGGAKEEGEGVYAALHGDQIAGREDSMRVLAASNTILALVLVGVLVLQAGQWYAEKREAAEAKEFKEREAKEAAKQTKHGKEGKKKQ